VTAAADPQRHHQLIDAPHARGADARRWCACGGEQESVARTIERVLVEARSRLVRVTPTEARAARATGAVVVDIRPEAQRRQHGELAGALIVERNVLEWRLDPASAARLPIAEYDLPILILCQEGYTSSLAAASLQDLGLWRATDVVGGFDAWRSLYPEDCREPIASGASG
jgi:rhodanese-related sulfurtransferase